MHSNTYTIASYLYAALKAHDMLGELLVSICYSVRGHLIKPMQFHSPCKDMGYTNMHCNANRLQKSKCVILFVLMPAKSWYILCEAHSEFRVWLYGLHDLHDIL